MTKKRRLAEQEVLQALGDAVTRAVHWAPESLLTHLGTEKRASACRRLALRVLHQLGGDGWGEARRAKRGADLDVAIVSGIASAGEGILSTLSEARRCNGKLLDGIGLHIGTLILAAVKESGARLKRTGAPVS